MGLLQTIKKRFSNRDIDWDELEELLIGADLGPPMALEIIDDLQDQGRNIEADAVLAVTREHLARTLPATPSPLVPLPGGAPRVILVAGVNGTGKTTSTAKLAHHLQNQGHGVVLAAADTFRAAAIEQLESWGERLGIPVISTHYQGDPGAVCFDAYEAAVRREAAFLICDTAGRLHTRSNLMEELKKVRRILAKKDEAAPHDRLLVVDATTGSNALVQAREFHAILDLTGLILTKLDGSGRGGMAVAIHRQLGIPPLFLGTGEGVEDFEPFEREAFLEGMI